MGVARADRPPLAAPFVGERYVERKQLSAVIAPPYDVLSPEQREQYARRHEHNIVRLTLPEGGEERYRRSAECHRTWLRAGVFAPDKSASVYALRQEFTTPDGRRHARTGVIAGIAVEPFADGRVRPHERTHAGPREDRLALLRATGAVFESLLMLARDDDGELADLLEAAAAKRPSAVAELESVAMCLWRVPGSRGRALADAAGRGALYIADGHHRYETAVAYRAERPVASRIPALVVPAGDAGLVVLPTHRIVRAEPIARAAVIAALRERFQIREVPPASNFLEALRSLQGRGAACILVLPEGPALALLLKTGAPELEFAKQPEVASLDVAQLDERVVARLLAEAGTAARVEHSPSADRVIDTVRRGDAAAGVLLNPTRVGDVLAVADAGAVMPQKSTYFYPKVPSGLVVMRYP